MVNFENGELIKEAYVEIDGKEYEVHMPQYSGKTPLSAEIINKAQKELKQETKKELQTQINSLASGSPFVASSVDEMTDITRVYVNTSDGHWYTYNGAAWVDGGVYQATEIAENSVSRNKTTFYNKTDNLFDYENADIINAIPNTDGIMQASATSQTLILPIESSTDYIISIEKFGKKFVVADSEEYPQIGTSVKILDGSIDTNNNIKIKKITTSENANYLIVFYSNTYNIENSNNSYTEEEIRKTICIKGGTSYKGYTSSHRIELEENCVKNENIEDNTVEAIKLNKETSSQLYNFKKSPQFYGFNNAVNFSLKNGTVNSDGSIDYTNLYRAVTDYLENSSDSITIINNSDKYQYRIIEYASDNTVVADNNYTTQSKRVYSLNENTSKFILNVSFATEPNATKIDDEVMQDIVNNIMICEGEYGIANNMKFLNKKILFDGDSITYGITSGSNRATSPYPSLVGKILNCEIENIAIAGARYCKRDDKDIDISTRAENFDYSGYDYIILAAGTNDWTDAFEIGELTDDSRTTIYGALNYVIGRIYEDNQNAVIGIMTPIARFRQGSTYANCLHDVTNSNGKTLLDITDAIINYCNYYSIPVCDLSRNSPLNQWNQDNDEITTDRLHLQQKGYEIMANKVAGWINAKL